MSIMRWLDARDGRMFIRVHGALAVNDEEAALMAGVTHASLIGRLEHSRVEVSA